MRWQFRQKTADAVAPAGYAEALERALRRGFGAACLVVSVGFSIPGFSALGHCGRSTAILLVVSWGLYLLVALRTLRGTGGLPELAMLFAALLLALPTTASVVGRPDRAPSAPAAALMLVVLIVSGTLLGWRGLLLVGGAASTAYLLFALAYPSIIDSATAVDSIIQQWGTTVVVMVLLRLLRRAASEADEAEQDARLGEAELAGQQAREAAEAHVRELVHSKVIVALRHVSDPPRLQGPAELSLTCAEALSAVEELAGRGG